MSKMVEKINVITSNPDKVKAAEKAFEGTDIELSRIDNKFEEIQADSSMEIARHTVENMMDDFDNPVVREDHSLYLKGLEGIPGPYMSYFDRNMSVELLLELLEDRSREGYFEICAATGYNGDIKEYCFQIPIEIAEEPRGEEGNIDRVLMLEDGENTFSESNSDRRTHIFNQNFREIAEDFS